MTPDPPTHATRPNADPLTRRLEAELAATPPIAIPADFASRVASAALAEAALAEATLVEATQRPMQQPVALPRLRFARSATAMCTVGVLTALLANSPGLLTHSVSESARFLWLLSAEAVLLAAALGPWGRLWISAD